MSRKEWEMRRKDRQLEEAEARSLAERGEYGVLSLVGTEGEAYGVPMSYWFCGNSLYLHCAREGRKLECLAKNPRVCFVVVGENRTVFTGDFTSLYESVILEGMASLVKDEAEKEKALLALCEKYLPGHDAEARKSVEHAGKVTTVVRVDVERLTGKANKGK